MLNTLILGMALTVGQSSPIPSQVPAGPNTQFADTVPLRIPETSASLPAPHVTVIPAPGRANMYPILQNDGTPKPMPSLPTMVQAPPAMTTMPWTVPSCCGPTKKGLHDCGIEWLRPWKCEDLEMKPFEPKPSCYGCKGLFWCPPEEEKNENGNGEKKNGEENKNGEEKKNGEEPKNGEEKKEEEPETLTPLMQAIQCTSPSKYESMKKKGDNLYGWIWAGYTQNFDSPRDRINYGVFHNWRSNDVRLDQAYLVYENALEHENELNFGYRVDFNAGHHAPIMVANGLFSSFTGFDSTSGFGVAGPASFRQINRIGIDLPQFYVNAHIPNVITEKGVDLLAGKFYTLMGREVYPAPLTEFYSRSYEIMFATPFTHTGALATLHATDTVDVTAGVIRGWDVFDDNNDSCSFTGNVIWTSCDKRYSWTTAWITGPEQFQNNQNNRTMVTSYVTAKHGTNNEWTFSLAGHIALENNAALDATTGVLNDAEWYGVSGYAFYTIDPRITLGARAEWFRDDDGVRTAILKRPGFAANFYELTLNLSYRPYQNLRFRPEIRFDYSNGPAIDGSGARPYNDQRDKFQTTAAFDFIYEF